MSPELVDDWHDTLMQDEEWLTWWTEIRQVSVDILRERKVGAQGNRQDAPEGFRYTIPVWNADGELVDVKKYAPGATERKNIHTRGHGSPCRLSGIDWLVDADPETDEVWVVGGEPDALRLMTAGLLAVSGTSGEKALPQPEDMKRLRGFRVNVCLDMDGPGRAGAKKWVAALLPVAAAVKNIEWPEDQGKDVTDFLNNGHTVEELLKIADETPPLAETQRPLADLLAAALKRVESGEGRNNTSFWLAQQLRDERYPLATAERFMVEEYHAAVDDPEDPFPIEEITGPAAALYQAYSVPAREPSGLGPSRATSGDGKRPPLDVSSGPDLIDTMLSQLGTGPTSGLYMRSGRLVRIISMGEDGYAESEQPGEKDGPAQLHILDGKALRALLQLRYLTYKVSAKGDRRRESPTVPACEDVVSLAKQGDCDQLPILRGVIHTPIVRADGSIFDSPGYDHHTRLLYLPNGLEVPAVPGKPTRGQLATARDSLLYILQDFPFVTDSDRANYLGMLLTPLLRLLAPGPWPLFVLNAHMAGSGKTLLAKIPDHLYGTVVRSEPSDKDEEVRKSITSILVSTTAPVVVFDNMRRVLTSAVIEKLLTDASWSDRVLGKSEETPAALRNDRLWVGTGNNVQVGGDMSRRSVWSNIDPDNPKPWLRTGFAEPDLPGYLASHRGPILAALLTLVRAWVSAGRPPGGHVRADDYREWASTVGGILVHAGIPGEFWSPETDRAPVAVGDDEWAPFLAGLHAVFGDAVMTAREVLERSDSNGSIASVMAGSRLRDVLPGDLAEKVERSGYAGAAKSLGRWFANNDGRYAGPYVARSAGNDGHGTKLWRVDKEGD